MSNVIFKTCLNGQRWTRASHGGVSLCSKQLVDRVLAAAELLFGDPDLNQLDRPFHPPRSDTAPKSTADNYQDFAQAYTLAKVETIRRFGLPPLVWSIVDFFNDPVAGPMDSAFAYLEPLVIKALERQANREKSDVKDEDDEISYLEHLTTQTNGMYVSLTSI